MIKFIPFSVHILFIYYQKKPTLNIIFRHFKSSSSNKNREIKAPVAKPAYYKSSSSNKNREITSARPAYYKNSSSVRYPNGEIIYVRSAYFKAPDVTVESVAKIYAAKRTQLFTYFARRSFFWAISYFSKLYFLL